MKMLKTLLSCLFLLVSGAALAAEEPDHTIHEELRALLGGMQQAINSGKYENLAPYFAEKMRVTTINQETLSSRPDIVTYFNHWFGPGGYLKSVEMKLSADALTELYADKTMGVVRGDGQERYALADGRHFDMKTRWTATVIKDTDGKWRILALHIGTNFLDNPILAKAENALVWGIGGGIAGGLILGVLFGYWNWGRRRKA
jgi:hypothetical protein